MTNTSLSQAERIDSVCDRFEAEWRAGRSPRIDDFLSGISEADRPAIRDALQAVESELRGAGDTSVTRSSVRNDASPDSERTAYYRPKMEAMPETIGRFRVLAVLGNGAFGKVYRAEDPQLGRQVAVKVPLETAVRTGEEREKFLKEARAAANINHPNICQIHEVGEYENMPYIVMALVNGQSLSDMLKARKQPMGGKQAAIVARKLALALAVAHEKGIVHRDLKPANIMYDSDRKDVVVMDFGLARGPRLGDARGTQSGIIMGTPAYMSPEQARGDSKDVGPAGDIYSLGVILYELLTNTRPFVGTATEVIGQILHVEPEAPSKRKAGLDPRLEAVCMKAMAKDPATRYKTMREVAAAIDPILRAPAPGLPANPGAETVRAERTKNNDGALTTSENRKLENVFQAIFEERQTTKAETAAAIEAAVKKHRTPRWMFVLLAFLAVAACAGIIFFTKSDKVKVTIELTDVDLADKSLSFFLDGKSVAAEKLANPVELSPGEHQLVVKRGKEIVKIVQLTVTGGRDPGIKIKNIPLPEEIEQVDDRQKWQGKWRCVGEKSQARVWTDDELKAAGKVMEVKGDQLVIERTFNGKFMRFTGSLKLDQNKSPKQFDWVGKDDSGNAFDMSGVYEFDGGKVRFIYTSTKNRGRASWNDTLQHGIWLEFERLEDDGFVPLFNGKDLTGWKRTPEGRTEWRVEQGILLAGKAGSDPNDRCYLVSDRADYSDFHLRIEAMLDAKADSGAMIRLQPFPAQGVKLFERGYEVQLNCDPRTNVKTGGLFVARGTGGPFAAHREDRMLVDPDKWFTLDVIVQGDRIVTKVDGVVAADYRDPDRHFDRGHIGLQYTRGLLKFRKIDLRETAPADGFVSLFNGKDFTGWKRADGAPNLRGWAVRNGTIARDKPSELANDGYTNSIWTQKPYGDFILEAEITGSGNSGIFFRNSDLTKYPIVGGLEMQINLPPSGKDPWQTGSIWGRQSPSKRNEKAGEWNTVRITARGPSITIELNGEVVNKLDCDAMTEPVRLAGQPELPPLRDMPRKGLIGLQAHAGDVSFRNIRIKELKDDGFVPLFNGKDLTGWLGAHNAWRWEADTLVGSFPSGYEKNNFLYSTKSYGDFEMKFQVRLPDGIGNSGVQIRSRIYDAAIFKIAGPQVEVDADNGSGGLYGEGDGGWMKKAPVELVRQIFRPGEFNDYFIRAVGKHVKIVVNGETFVDDDFPTIPDQGRLAFQLHTARKAGVHFRNILFKELKEGDGFVPLFNGKDLTGWKTHPDQPGGWTVEDGYLTGRSGSSNHLFSEAGDYGDFHLRAECRTNRFGNSGIYFRAPFAVDRRGTVMMFPVGYEAQIIHEFPKPNVALTGSIKKPGKILARVEGCAIKPDEWFNLEVIAKGKRLIVKVNGVETANVEDSEFTRGHLCLQACSDSDTKADTFVQFRKLELKDK